MKKQLELSIRLILIITIILSNFGFIPVALAKNYEKGDIINPTQTTGSLDNLGDVELKREVSKTAEDDVFEVTLTVKGATDTITSVNPLYVAIAFDTSGSMICKDPSVASTTTKTLSHYQAADGTYLRCAAGSSTLLKGKWENAVQSTINFASEVVKNKDARVSLITYNDDATSRTNWQNTSFQASDFGHPISSTNLPDALSIATEKFQTAPSNAKKVILVVGDGEPKTLITNLKNKSLEQGNIAKSQGIEIYALGYEVDNDARNFFKQLAGEEQYFESSQSNVNTIANTIASNLNQETPAIQNAIIKDQISAGFTYVEDSAYPKNIASINSKNIEFNIGEITTEVKTVSYKIKINKNLSDGLYQTNDNTSLTYTSYDNSIKEENFSKDEAPQIYWEQEKYEYTLNYYKENVSESNKIKTETAGSGVLNEVIDLNNIDINKYKPTFGYKDGIIKISSPNYTIVEGENKINIVYPKRDDLSYVVKYLENDKEINTQIKTGKTYLETYEEKAEVPFGYKLTIDETDIKNITVDNDDKTISFKVEKRNDLSYTVKYLDQLTKEELAPAKVALNQTYLDTISEKAKEISGYKTPSEDTKTFTINKDNLEIDFYYTKKADLSYTVRYYQDSIEGTLLGEETFNNIEFNTEITSSDLDINKYRPKVGYKNGVLIEGSNTIIDGVNIINIVYEKRTDMSYIVRYQENDQILKEEEQPNKKYLETYTEVITLDKIPFGYQLKDDNTKNILVDKDDKVLTFNFEKRNNFSYKVNYIEKETNKVLNEQAERTGKTYLKTYQEKAITIKGYNIVGDNTYSITMNKENQELTFYYTKKNDLTYSINFYKNNKEEKPIATKKFKDQTFSDVIKIEDIEEYINLYKPEKGYKDGIVDTNMPFEIKDEKNTINVIYPKKDDLTYRVEYYYDGSIDSSKTEYFENITFEEVIINYQEKLPIGYKFISASTPLIIEDTTDNVIRVYYESVQEGEINPPKTGIGFNYITFTYILPEKLRIKDEEDEEEELEII